jgi:hypothetical protein
MIPTTGIRRFLVLIDKSGTGDQTIIAAVSAEKIRLLSCYGMVATPVAGTYGTVKFASGPDIAPFVCTDESFQTLLDPAAGHAVSYASNEPLKITVDAVSGNGFADGKAWIWGTYEVTT